MSLFRGKLGADENGAAPMPKQEEEIDKKIKMDWIVGAERAGWSLCLTHLYIPLRRVIIRGRRRRRLSILKCTWTARVASVLAT